MDGLKYVVPMSCHKTNTVVSGALTLFGDMPDTTEIHACEGCRQNRPKKHNGIYAKVMDWKGNTVVRFVDILS